MRLQSLSTVLRSKFFELLRSKCKNIIIFAVGLIYPMLRTSKQLVRIALFVMLFQFVCPAFISIVVQQIPTTKETAFSTQHTSIVAPMLLKEKDEKESAEEFLSVCNSTTLLDFTSHGSNLTAAHDNKHADISERDTLILPPLFTMHCALLI